MIAEAMHGQNLPSLLNPVTGMVHFSFEDPHANDDDEITEELIEIPVADSQQEYREMESFVALVADPKLKAELERALDGSGAFRRFRKVVYDRDGLGKTWGRYQEALRNLEAMDWLAGRQLLSAEEEKTLRETAVSELEAASFTIRAPR